jgi:hypothetical protein
MTQGQPSEYEHPTLGLLLWNGNAVRWETQSEILPGHSVAVSIEGRRDRSPDELAESLAAAADHLNWAKQSVPVCREWIADDLLNIYNEAWADEDPEEGPPPLNRSEFLAHLRLVDITIHQDGSVGWMYDPGAMFTGHGIWLWIGADRVFRKASLFG